MVGTQIQFKKRVSSSSDAFNNPVYAINTIAVDDCLIAPISEPTNAREEQAMHQQIVQVRVHLPKSSTADISDSYIAWDGNIFQIDSDSVKFMDENTPGRWNRYFRGESVGVYDASDEGGDIFGAFFITEDSSSFLIQESSN